jgi:hypothetical protein
MYTFRYVGFNFHSLVVTTGNIVTIVTLYLKKKTILLPEENSRLRALAEVFNTPFSTDTIAAAGEKFLLRLCGAQKSVTIICDLIVITTSLVTTVT